MIAMPVWFLYALWGWLRRRSLSRNTALPAWRRSDPADRVLVIAMTGLPRQREGAYFDSRPAK